jgi:hypothetical protein
VVRVGSARSDNVPVNRFLLGMTVDGDGQH